MNSYRLWPVSMLTVWALCVPCFCTVSTAAAGDPTDNVFLHQLVERRLHELAEQHCRDLMARAPDAEEKAEWQHRLTTVAQHHAWFLDTASRTEFLTGAIEQISAFVKEHPPGPRWELRLRLHQARTMLTSLQIAAVGEVAAHLADRDNRWEGVGIESAGDHIRAELGSNADDAIALTNEILKKIDQGRNQIRSHARDLRTECRILLARLHLIAFQLKTKPSAASNEHKDAVEQLTSLVLRSTQDVQVRFEMELLKADLERDLVSHLEIDARIRRLKASQLTSQTLHPVLVQARLLLRTQRAEEALRSLGSITRTNALQREQRAWLQLEAQLVLAEIADELNDTDYRSIVDGQFQRQLQVSRQATHGVFRDAVNAVVDRYNLVASVGVTVADLIEQVDDLRRIGDNEQALSLAERALSRLPESAAELSRAALTLHIGEVLIDLERWSPARRKLEQAITLFSKSGDTSRQAVADLLRVFVQAQLLRIGDAEVTAQVYQKDLQAHINNYPTQPTSEKARTWLLQLLEPSDPEAAVRLIEAMLPLESDASGKVKLLQRMGRLLTRLTDSDAVALCRQSFREHVAEVANEYGNDEHSLALVRFYERWLQFQPDQSLDWKASLSNLPALRQGLLEVEAEEKFVADAMLDVLIIEAVASARTTRDPLLLADLSRRLTTLRSAEMLRVVRQLYIHYQHGQLRAGDPWLVGVSDDLVRRLVRNASDPQQLAEFLRIATTNVSLSGDTRVQEQILNRLVALKLPDGDLLEIADALSTGASAGKPATDIDRNVISVQDAFWQRVLQSADQGTGLWLEANLQLAEFALVRDDQSDARRRLGVVQTLYPDWGSAERKKRAKSLMGRLTN